MARLFPGGHSGVPRALLAAALLAFAILVLRIAAVESPTMASDEYAYVGAARYAATPDQMYQLDPGMQPLGNKFYPALYSAWAYVSPEHAELVGRVFNAAMFVLGSLLLFGIFSRIFDRGSALVSALLYLALPFSFYSITLLPEVEFQLSVYLVSFTVVLAGARPRYWLIALAAVFSALSYFVKPHAAAMIAACGAYWFATGLLDRSGTMAQRLLCSVARAGLYLVLTGALITVVNKLMSAGTGAGASVVPSFYNKYLGQLFAGGFVLSSLGTFLDYLLGHLWLLIVYFAPGIVVIVVAAGGLLFRGSVQEASEEEVRRKYFALYVVLLLSSFLAMIAMFTASAASMGAGEEYRMHGRYLAALLPLLLGYSVWACGRFSRRAVAVLALAALWSFALFGRGLYKLYPWDYPDAFGFFNPSARYWSFEGSQHWTLWFILVVGTVCWLAAIRSKSARGAFVVFSLAWMLASHAQMWKWLDQQSASSRAHVEPAHAIEAFLGPMPAGSGLVLTQDRYGLTSNFLMGLRTPQHVKAYPATHIVKQRDVPEGVKWVVAPEAMEVDIDGAAKLKFGTQNLFLLNGSYQWPIVGENSDRDRAQVGSETNVPGQELPAHVSGRIDAAAGAATAAQR